MVADDITKQRPREYRESEKQNIPVVTSPGIQETDTDIFKGVGRNEPCPCGSGLKYKKYHGK